MSVPTESGYAFFMLFPKFAFCKTNGTLAAERLIFLWGYKLNMPSAKINGIKLPKIFLLYFLYI